ncbi:spermidine synthase [Quadrisphaera sp. DSM 44207]|uniref:spermidine synthase n=1 Tax=Quadrisphaera sp. DSM 44207 TaxID=1881057 RepID=UPI00087E8A16|nr:fused MFS/spermidine synthase [Quadrisphaera sp. DSM 44207]SDQ38837.1 Methyltransferase domain-containing protein [Quadrisphaera sp. DSM 44207]
MAARRHAGGPQRRSGTRPLLRAGLWTTSTGSVELVPERGDPLSWTLYVNGVPSSPVHLGDPAVLEFEYLQWMADAVDVAAPAPAPAPLRAVHLGGGACALPRHLEAVRPGSRQVVVELDAELARLVRAWLDLPRSPRLRIRVDDARAGLAAQPDASADLVVRDVFAGDTTPEHVSTVEFLADAARVLAPGGLYLANVVDRTSRVGLRAEVAAAQRVFASVALALEPGVLRGRRHGNAVLVGSDAALPVAELVRRLGSGAARAAVLHDDALRALSSGVTAPRDGGADRRT